MTISQKIFLNLAFPNLPGHSQDNELDFDFYFYIVKYNYELLVTKIANYFPTYFKFVNVFLYITSSDKLLTNKTKQYFWNSLKLR